MKRRGKRQTKEETRGKGSREDAGKNEDHGEEARERDYLRRFTVSPDAFFEVSRELSTGGPLVSTTRHHGTRQQPAARGKKIDERAADIDPARWRRREKERAGEKEAAGR